MKLTRFFAYKGQMGCFQRTMCCFSNYSNDPIYTVPELRRKLSMQITQQMPRMRTIDTESRLIILLSRSANPGERQEALEMGEELWAELHEATTPIPFSSRTTMKTILCSSLRRSALVSKNRALADLWTQRFADRASSISPHDFGEAPVKDKVLGWREARAAVRPGTGIYQEDVEADAREVAKTEEEEASKAKTKEPSPFQAYRRDVMLDHPTVRLAFKKRDGPGPRYTG